MRFAFGASSRTRSVFFIREDASEDGYAARGFTPSCLLTGNYFFKKGTGFSSSFLMDCK